MLVMSTQERTPRLPSYRRHNPSGQAVVTLSGRDYYLGLYGTNASRSEYDRITAEWLASGRTLQKSTAGNDYSINEATALYLRFDKGYYLKDGKQTSTINSIKLAVRAEMVRTDWYRSMINDSVRRLSVESYYAQVFQSEKRLRLFQVNIVGRFAGYTWMKTIST